MILLVLCLVAAPFVLPVLFYVALRRLRNRVDHLEVVEDQHTSIDALKQRIREQREPVVETKRAYRRNEVEPIVETKHPIVPPTVAAPLPVEQVAMHADAVEPTPPPAPQPTHAPGPDRRPPSYRPPTVPRPPMPPGRRTRAACRKAIRLGKPIG